MTSEFIDRQWKVQHVRSHYEEEEIYLPMNKHEYTALSVDVACTLHWTIDDRVDRTDARCLTVALAVSSIVCCANAANCSMVSNTLNTRTKRYFNNLI